MTVTVAIPSTGERPVMRRAVETAIRSASLVSQDAEVLVVVNGRSDAPGLGRVDSPLLRVIHLEQRNVSLARNCALASARHDVVLFADDDGIIPDSWCAELGGALCERGWAVVTAPVRVPVSGPVTALIDYQRIFDPPPAGPDEAHVLTGNCGMRRSMIPPQVRYDADHLPTAAEDVDFSFALRKAGLRIHWLADAAPGLHNMPENLNEIIERGVRYGRGGARLYLLRGHQKMAVPGALSWYEAMGSGQFPEYRRFPEFVWPGVRVVFTALEYMLNASLLLGYLDELGTQLGHRLIELDYDALHAAWRELFGQAADGVSGLSAGDWNSLPADYSRLERELAEPGPAQDIAASVSAALGRHAPLAEGEPPAQLRRMLDPGGLGGPGGPGGQSGPGIAAQQSSARLRLGPAWDKLRQAGGPASGTELERCIRAAGLPFRRGGQELEAMLRARRASAS
jgi:hypothetical protein